MITATIRRRVRNLETEFAAALMPDYPPLTREEVTEIERRICAGEPLTRSELERIEKETPIIDGEFLISCYGGQLCVKHYIGINLADI
jgi:hypothetical protein